MVDLDAAPVAETDPLMTPPTLARLDDDALLFDEARQRLYALDALTAAAWTAMRDGGDAGALAALQHHGLPADAAAAYLESFRANWGELVVTPAPAIAAAPPAETAPDGPRACFFACADQRFVIRVPDAAAQSGVAAILGHLSAPGSAVDFDITAQRNADGSGYILSTMDGPVAAADAGGLAVAVKNEIFERTLARRPALIALHAAGLATTAGAVLLAGASGSGKTTLAAVLSALGLPLIADDVCLLDADTGHVSGLPFALALKPGSWAPAAAYWPDLMSLPVWRRPDGRLVRYLAPQLVTTRAAVDRIVFPRYQSGAPVSETPARKADALQLLLREARNADRRLTAAGFGTLCRVLANARVSTLIFGDADAAAQHILRGGDG